MKNIKLYAFLFLVVISVVSYYGVTVKDADEQQKERFLKSINKMTLENYPNKHLPIAKNSDSVNKKHE
jgi:hypothetical protein